MLMTRRPEHDQIMRHLRRHLRHHLCIHLRSSSRWIADIDIIRSSQSDLTLKIGPETSAESANSYTAAVMDLAVMRLAGREQKAFI